MNNELIERLRCKYARGPRMENGEPEFGYRDYSGVYTEITLPSRIMLEAADYIANLEQRLSDCKAALSQREAQPVASVPQEIERLTKCLAKANERAEHFEREWYLRGDIIEQLRDAEQWHEEEKEKLAQWMIGRSIATGHGDTISDLIAALESHDPIASVPQDVEFTEPASLENRMKELHYKNLLADHDMLVRELDVLLNGELSVKQPRLLDIVASLSAKQKSCQSPAVRDVKEFIAKNQWAVWRANALADTTKHIVIDASNVETWMAGHARAKIDPDQTMLDAARDWSYKKYGRPIGNDAAIGCWKAMLTASKESGNG